MSALRSYEELTSNKEPGDGPKSPSSDSPNFEVATKLDKGKQRAVSESGEEDDAEDAAEETELFGQFYSREDVLEQQRMIEEYSAKQAATRQAAEGRGQWEKALQSRNLATIEEDEEDDLQVAIRQSVQDQQHETDQSSSSTAGKSRNPVYIVECLTD